MKIELQDIHKSFGRLHANDRISATFHSGRIIGILGENGAGKSTLMKILSGFQPPDSGRILLDDALAHYRSPQEAIRAGIGMLQQDPLDIPALTVLENFVYGQPGRSIGIPARAAARRLGELCARFGFTLHPDTLASSLTIGQRQQLEIIRLIALGVRTLILDEPTTGISADQKNLLFDALRALARDGATVLLVSHKLEDVISLCDEVIVLRAGRLVGTSMMPLSKEQLVTMMFGEALTAQPRPPAAIGQVVASLNSVTLRGRRVTVHDFSLHVRSGEVIGLAGLDESGQELVLRALAGLISPQHGTVTLAGRDMTHQHYRSFRAMGVAFSAAGRLEEGLIAGLTITEHVALAAQHGALIDWRAARAEADARIRHYAVRGRPESPIESLSGGNQQRVLMALMADAPLLMALEQPTRGLDVDSSRWIWEQLLARRELGTAIVFTSPELDELVTHSDRILVACGGHFHEVTDVEGTSIEQLGRLIGGDFPRPAALTHR
jgi:simple sugar transport system ATP-binding protein